MSTPTAPAREHPSIQHARVFISVAEESADVHAAALVRAARDQLPGVTFYGLTGPRLRELGIETVYDFTSHAAMLGGVFGVLGRAQQAVKAVERAWRLRRPDLVVLLDSPELHLGTPELGIAGLAARAKRLGLPVLYYIAPQTWAARPWRQRWIRRDIDRLACILPFEEKHFQRAAHPSPERQRAGPIGAPSAGERARSEPRAQASGPDPSPERQRAGPDASPPFQPRSTPAGIEGSGDRGIEGSRDRGIEGSRDRGIKGSRDRGIKGFRAIYVGHPLFETLRQERPIPETVEFLKLRAAGRPIVALLPGSRQHVIETMLPLQLDVIRRLRAAGHDVYAAISCVSDRRREQVRALLHDSLVRESVPHSLVRESLLAPGPGPLVRESLLAPDPTGIPSRAEPDRSPPEFGAAPLVRESLLAPDPRGIPSPAEPERSPAEFGAEKGFSAQQKFGAERGFSPQQSTQRATRPGDTALHPGAAALEHCPPPETTDAGIDLVVADNASLLTAADLVLVASGTATLQVAYYRKPMIVMYDAARWLHWPYRLLGRLALTTPHLSLVNILAGARIVPEFMPFVRDLGQVAAIAGQLLTDDGWRRLMAFQLDEVVRPLEGSTASANVCRLMRELLNECATERTATAS